MVAMRIGAKNASLRFMLILLPDRRRSEDSVKESRWQNIQVSHLSRESNSPDARCAGALDDGAMEVGAKSLLGRTNC